MSWLAFLILPSLLAVVAFHMVRPNFRDLKISAAPLLPDPPKSTAPRNRLSLSAPILSLRFWLRLLAMLCLLAALGARLWTPLDGPRDAGALRFVLDVSPSMGLPDNGGGRLRIDTAARTIEATLTMPAEQSDPPVCIDLVAAGSGFRHRLSGPNAAFPETAQVLATEGRSVADIASALRAQGPGLCPDAPDRALILTDRPRQRIDPATFAGTYLWYQVGEALDNAALTGARFVGGGLSGAPGRLDIRASVFGTQPQELWLTLDAPDGARRIALRPDGLSAGGWQGEADVTAAGLYELRLEQGGAFRDDDRLTVSVAPPDDVYLDWRLTELSAPSASRQTPAAEGGVVVAPLTAGQPLPSGPFVLIYSEWSAGSGPDIGAFDGTHPLLENVNLDVFERLAPALPTGLADGLDAVLGAEGTGGQAWLSARAAPRGAIVPAPRFGDDDTAALSLLIFFNALRWVSDGTVENRAEATFIAADGSPAQRPWLESDTARALGENDDPTLLFEMALPETTQSNEDAPDYPLTAWLIALACLFGLAERALGPVWQKGART